jgi:hypothetical protein
VFDEENLVSYAGLVPVLELAEQAGLSQLLDEHVRFTSERVKSGAAKPTPKLTSIIAGMACGADSIDDLDVIRAGGMKRAFHGVYASATVGIFLREFTHGHTRQLQAVLRAHLIALVARTPILAGIDKRCFVDIDSLLRPVYGHAKQGASFGHTKISGKTVLRRGLSPLEVTISTQIAAPVLAGVRLRAGRAGSAKGAASMLVEAINTAVAAGACPDRLLVPAGQPAPDPPSRRNGRREPAGRSPAGLQGVRTECGPSQRAPRAGGALARQASRRRLGTHPGSGSATLPRYRCDLRKPAPVAGSACTGHGAWQRFRLVSVPTPQMRPPATAPPGGARCARPRVRGRSRPGAPAPAAAAVSGCQTPDTTVHPRRDGARLDPNPRKELHHAQDHPRPDRMHCASPGRLQWRPRARAGGHHGGRGT